MHTAYFPSHMASAHSTASCLRVFDGTIACAAVAVAVRCPCKPATLRSWLVYMACMVSCGFFHTLLKDEGGQLWCWGDNRKGQCGAGTAAPSHIKAPMLIEGLPRVAKFVAGGYHSIAMHCALTVHRVCPCLTLL